MCQIRAPAGINLTPSQHKDENMPIAMLQASTVEDRSSLGFSFGLASVFSPRAKVEKDASIKSFVAIHVDHLHNYCLG